MQSKGCTLTTWHAGVQCSSDIRTSKRVLNSFQTRVEHVHTKVWTRSQTSSVNAFTAFTFAERVCFCLDFLCFGVFYCSHETKWHFCFTVLFGDHDIGLERIDSYVDLDLQKNLCNSIVLHLLFFARRKGICRLLLHNALRGSWYWTQNYVDLCLQRNRCSQQ